MIGAARCGSQGGDFTIESLEPRVFLDAATLSQADASQVTAWTSYGATQDAVYTSTTAARRPLYYSTAVAGRPAVLFDGSDDYIFTLTSITGSLPYTVAMVVQPTKVSNPGGLAYTTGFRITHDSPGNVNRTSGTTLTSGSGSELAIGVPSRIIATCSDEGGRLRVNGAEVSDAGANNVMSGSLQFGWDDSGSPKHFWGYMSMAAVLPFNPSGAEMDALDALLQRDYLS